MKRLETDILISGGGVAGLTAAAGFGSAGFRVVCVDPNPPVTEAHKAGADLRTTAFLQPAKVFLEQAGIWENLAGSARPLNVMRIVDAGGPEATARVSKDFEAEEISELPFGWNFPNTLLRKEILNRINALPNVTFRPGIGFKSMVTRTTRALVTLSDGTQVSAMLVIGADGRSSPVREAVGIAAKTTRYSQKAVVFAVTHDLPHDNVSTEVHRTGGPFTLVPLPDYKGQPCSSVVWMEPGRRAYELAELSESAFERAATERSAGVYGSLKLASQRQIWPIIAQIADRLTAERTALVAEAAHVVPPIGAQGLNMSLGDISTLLQLAKDRPGDLGDAKMLSDYEKARHKEISLRVRGVDALNRASIAGSPLLRDLRAKGIEALYGVKPVRKALMKMGLGAK